jgi:hypothetical protein
MDIKNEAQKNGPVEKEIQMRSLSLKAVAAPYESGSRYFDPSHSIESFAQRPSHAQLEHEWSLRLCWRDGNHSEQALQALGEMFNTIFKKVQTKDEVKADKPKASANL